MFLERELKEKAESTGLEPATSAVTGQRSNQLSYDSISEEAEARTDCLTLQPKKRPRRPERGQI
jgi:endonuclease I